MSLCVSGKAVVSMPVGGGPALMNNYMIAQPPGFQLAAFVSVTLLMLLLSHVLYPVPYIRRPISNDDVVEDKREGCQQCFVFFVPHLCT